jgi:hypothetical protein
MVEVYLRGEGDDFRSRDRISSPVLEMRMQDGVAVFFDEFSWVRSTLAGGDGGGGPA